MTTQEILTVVLYGVLGLISLISGIVNFVRTGNFRKEFRMTGSVCSEDRSSLTKFKTSETPSETQSPPAKAPTETPTEEERYNVEQSIISIYEDIQRVVDSVELIRSQLKKKE